MNIVHGDAPATSKQTYLIFILGGGDVREEGLTRQQASDRIAALKASKETVSPHSSKVVKTAKKSEAEVFADIIAEATEAANKAGDEWMAEASPKFRVVQRANPLDDNSPIVKDFGTMLDVCGFAGIEIGDKRTKFAKYLLTVQKSHYSVRLNHKYQMRQELGLAEAIASASLAVFRKHGVDKGLRYYSRID